MTCRARSCVLLLALAAAFLLAFPPHARALLQTNENATDELGQFASTTSDTTLNWTQGDTNNNDGGGATINALGLNGPCNSAIDLVNHRLFVVDQNNNRVLVYNLNTDNSISTSSGGHTASYVLGQIDFSSGAVDGGLGYPTAAVFNGPADLAYDAVNNRLFVTDGGTYRVLVFNTSSISNGMNASYVIGDTDFNGDCISCTGQNGLGIVAALAYDPANTRLFVADSDNNRVMVFNVPTGTNLTGENASYVLGQTNFSNIGHGHTASTMYEPDALAYDPVNMRLFVGEVTNNRVTVFNVPTGANLTGENASYVLGAASLTVAGSGNCTGSTFGNPGGVAYDSNPGHFTLFVGDWIGGRVLAFNASPAYIKNGENASYVIGAPNFTNCGADTTQNSLYEGNYVMYDPGSSRLFADDPYNNRVMIFDGGTLPQEVYGQVP